MVKTEATLVAPSLDPGLLRPDFPALDQKIHGHPLVYLDNAATTQKPTAVLRALDRYYRRDCSNVHRGVHTLSQRSTASYESARGIVQRFLGSSSDREIVFVRGATEGINLVARSFLGPRLEPGDEVLVTAMEHHANIVPWQLVCKAAGARLRVLPMDDRGELRLEELGKVLTERTRLLAAVHVSNALGTVNPVEELVAAARQRGVPVLLDGAQAVPHKAVNVEALGCDFYVFSGHKAFGPTGIGVLWGRREHLETMEPYQGGGDMIVTVGFEGSTFREPPARFEAGTPNIAGAIGLGAALEYLEELGLPQIEAYEAELLSYATQRIGSLPGIRLIGTARRKAGVLSFVVEGVHPHDVGTILDQRGVAVRVGHHCAQPVMAHFGVPATVRASFAFYNTRFEVDALEQGLREVKEIFGP